MENAIDYNDMTNKELQAICDEREIDVDSKNVSKPTKKEFIVAIEKFESKEQEDLDDFLDNEEGDKDGLQEEQETKKVVPVKSRAQLRREQREEMSALVRVVITSNATNQTKTNAIERITWGNRLLGHNTDNVVIGKPWHVREGALRNMEKAITTNSIQDDEGNQVRFETVPTYNIRRLDPLTKEELAVIEKRQIIRDASIESLI